MLLSMNLEVSVIETGEELKGKKNKIDISSTLIGNFCIRTSAFITAFNYHLFNFIHSITRILF